MCQLVNDAGLHCGSVTKLRCIEGYILNKAAKNCTIWQTRKIKFCVPRQIQAQMALITELDC